MNTLRSPNTNTNNFGSAQNEGRKATPGSPLSQGMREPIVQLMNDSEFSSPRKVDEYSSSQDYQQQSQ